MRRTIAASIIALMVGAGMASAAGQLGGVVGAAKKTGEVTKDVAEKTGKATTKGVKETKKAVTGEAHATCVDGTREVGKTEESRLGRMCKTWRSRQEVTGDPSD